jgi:hypothetical protein
VSMEPCASTNPKNGNKCEMARGHFGHHLVGNVYHPSETWVTPCSVECCFHDHDEGPAECIYCGKMEE